ncbi:hypothetical protein F4604DRAFT_1916007 [Suillus subluteus]|nr:hypothetical protein F4604DRAFT_1916007 [Suillus subluteus]
MPSGHTSGPPYPYPCPQTSSPLSVQICYLRTSNIQTPDPISGSVPSYPDLRISSVPIPEPQTLNQCLSPYDETKQKSETYHIKDMKALYLKKETHYYALQNNISEIAEQERIDNERLENKKIENGRLKYEKVEQNEEVHDIVIDDNDMIIDVASTLQFTLSQAQNIEAESGEIISHFNPPSFYKGKGKNTHIIQYLLSTIDPHITETSNFVSHSLCFIDLHSIETILYHSSAMPFPLIGVNHVPWFTLLATDPNTTYLPPLLF